MVGRPAKPTAFKIANGTRKDRISSDEPKIPAQLPSMPSHLDSEARREWKRLVKVLCSIGLLTLVDRGILACYCTAWSRLISAEAELLKEGAVLIGSNGGAYQNPWLAIANKATEQIAKYGSLLGFDPSSRSRVKVTPADDSKPNPLAEFMRGGRG